MESKELKFNATAGIYLLIALIYIFLLYTEVTGFKLSQLKRANDPGELVQRVPVEQPSEEEQTDG